MMNQSSAKTKKPRSGLNSGLDVLECIASRHRPITLTEIANAIGLSKSSVHQLLATLDRRGFVKRLPDQSYSIGMKAWEIGCVATPIGMARTAAPHMAQLVREIRDGVSLGVLDGAEMVCIHLIESPRAVRIHANVGDRTPAHCVSSGLAVLSAMDEEAVIRLLPETLHRATEDSIGDRAGLLKELARTRARGYSISRGAWRLDVAGVSIPLRGPDGRVAAALCVAAPRFRVTREWIEQVIPALRSTAENVERDFGAAAPAQALFAPSASGGRK
jgi:DNA-binding IclR family transcriptional regulator